MLEYTFIAGLFLITVDVHLEQMWPLPTMGRQVWHPQIPGQSGELMRVHGRHREPHFYGFGVYADLSPRNGLVRSCTRVGTIELLASVLSQRRQRFNKERFTAQARDVQCKQNNRHHFAMSLIRNHHSERKVMRTINIAFAIWCLQTPPPRMIMPAFTEVRASSFSARMSPTMSKTRPGDLNE